MSSFVDHHGIMRKTENDFERRPVSRDLRPLGRLFDFLKPYRGMLIVAMVALMVAAATVLAFGQVIRQVVDNGLSSGSYSELNSALLFWNRAG